MTKSRVPVIMLASGTVLSVLVGVLLSTWLNDASTGVLCALIAETLAMNVSLWARLSEAETRLAIQIESSNAVLQLTSRIANAQEPLISERYQELLHEMQELAEGRYDIRGLEAVYDDDIRSISELGRDDTLRSICPLANTAEEIERQLGNRSFVASTGAHKAAAERGVHVTRLFTIFGEEHFALSIVQKHLQELVHAKVECRYILRGDPAFREAQLIDPDFVVFGEEKISVGTIDPSTGTVNGTKILTDQHSVRSYIRDFEKLRRIANEYKDQRQLEQKPA